MRNYTITCLILIVNTTFFIQHAHSASSNGTRLLELAREEFGSENLTPADELLFTAVANGDTARCDLIELGQLDFADAGRWKNDRIINANRLVWLCTNEAAMNLVTHWGIAIVGAIIINDLELAYTDIPFPVEFRDCRIESTIGFIDARTKRLTFTGCHVEGIVADGLHAQGGMFLNGGFISSGEVNLMGATIEGNLDCTGGVIANLRANQYALNAEQIQVKGSVLLSNGFVSLGELRLLGATIGSNLECTDGLFRNPKGHSLSADRAQVSGSVYLTDGFNSIGEVRLVGATIGSNLTCRSGLFTNKSGIAINADRIRVTGSIFFSDGFRAQGAVRLVAAEVGSAITCENGTILGSDDGALVADRLQVEGDVALGDNFLARGKVRLLNGRLQGSLVMNGLIQPELSDFDLTDASVGTLWDHESVWPSSIKMNGFVYKRIRSIPIKARVIWLEKYPNHEFHPQPYDQLASVLTRMGREADATAVRIAKERQIASAFVPQRWRLINPKYWWYSHLGPRIGYGYEPVRALVDVIRVIGIGCLLFALGYLRGYIIPSVSDPYANSQEWDQYAEARKQELKKTWQYMKTIVRSTDHTWEQVVCGLFGAFVGIFRFESPASILYPKFNFVIYSIDTFVPIVNLGQANHWAPNPVHGRTGALLRLYLWVHIILGWVLSTLLVIGFSGIVRG